MSLNYDYGINVGNRFGGFVDHEEDPEEFLAQQTRTEEKTKKSKDTKTTTATSSSTTTGANTKSNKENVTGKSTTSEQRKQGSVAFSDNQQQSRPESGRGGGRGGYPRRGGSAGQDRPPYEGRGGRGGSSGQRFNRSEGQQGSSGFEQGADAWTGGDAGNENQFGGGSRGRGRGGGRGSGPYRGRGGRGRGYNNNRNLAENAGQGQEQEGSNWEQSASSAFDNRGQGGATEAEIPISPQGQQFESEQGSTRGGRGQFRSRTFRSNRNQGERSYHHEREGEQQGSQEDYRQHRRAHDRQPRNFVSTVKPIEKKDGQGAHNWGDPTEVPDEEVIVDDSAEPTAAPAAGTTTGTKDWSQQVDEAERQMMTLDEYKRQLEEKKKLAQEKLPQFNRRAPGEGEDPKVWKQPEVVYRKKNDDDETEEEEEGESAGEEEGSADENEEQTVGKKRIISIPLHFKPIEVPRGGSGGRGGQRGGRGGNRGTNRDEQGQARPAPQQQQQQQAPSSSQQTDEERPQSGYQGGRGGGGSRGQGRGEYRRSYGNAARGSRGGYNPTGKGSDTNQPLDLGNAKEFPTLQQQ